MLIAVRDYDPKSGSSSTRAEGSIATGTSLLEAALIVVLLVMAVRAFRRVDAERQASRARELAVVDAVTDAIITIDGDGRVLDFNPVAERTFGYRREDALGRELAQLIIPARLREAHRRGLRRCIATGQSEILGRRLEMPAMRADGSELPVELALSRLAWSGPPTFVGTARDITDRLRGDEALRRLAAIVESSADAIVAMSPDGTIVSWNAGAARIYGYRADEVLGRPVAMLVAPERAARAAEALRRFLQEEELLETETVHARKDGTAIAVAVTASLIRDESGSVSGISMITRDITARLERERTLRRLAAVVESSHEAVVAFEPDGTVIAWNGAAERIYGYAPGEIMGRSVSLLFAPEQASDSRAQLEEFFARLTSGESVERESVAMRKDGSQIDVSFTASPILDDDGALVAGAVIARDVTERLKLQAQLRQAQKMEAVGQLAGGIAHDFNNLLTVITGYGDIARRRIGAGPGASELGEIEGAADRAAQLTRQLLAFSRQQVLEPVLLDLNEVIRSLLPMLERLIGEDIEIAVLAQDGLAGIVADRGQIEQVIVNLAVNARDAMRAGGTLTVETRAAELRDARAREHAGLDPGPHVCLTVTDTGSGMDGETLEHIFEPFYTTKDVGRGTGLGLATVHGIVTQSGGRVLVYSEPGLGTTFKIFLPAGGASAAPPAPSGESDGERLTGTETILVCEDDLAVRDLIRTLLTAEGYAVLDAPLPARAIELAGTDDQQIDALISDVIMPQMPGPELAARVNALRPGMPTLFLSGYTAEVIHERGSLPPASAFLEKPFDRIALLRTLRDLLDEQSEQPSARRAIGGRANTNEP